MKRFFPRRMLYEQVAVCDAGVKNLEEDFAPALKLFLYLKQTVVFIHGQRGAGSRVTADDLFCNQCFNG